MMSPFYLGFPLDEKPKQLPASQQENESEPQGDENLKYYIDDVHPDR